MIRYCTKQGQVIAVVVFTSTPVPCVGHSSRAFSSTWDT